MTTYFDKIKYFPMLCIMNTGLDRQTDRLRLDDTSILGKQIEVDETERVER